MTAIYKILTANRLDNGAVVYFSRGRQWTLSLDENTLSTQTESDVALTAEGEAALADRIIVEPYLIPVEIENGVPIAQSKREQIRAVGPSITSDYSQNSSAAVAAAEGLSS